MYVCTLVVLRGRGLALFCLERWFRRTLLGVLYCTAAHAYIKSTQFNSPLEEEA